MPNAPRPASPQPALRALLAPAAIALAGLLCAGCSIWQTDDWTFQGGADVPESVSGMRPIYSLPDAYEVYADVVRAPVDAISVFEDGDLQFTIDAGRGVHVVDNGNPSAPRSVAFIRVLGVRTGSAADGRLYVNNFEDLVTLDLRDLDDIRVVDRSPDFYEAPPPVPPGSFRGFFECYDLAQGPLLGWESATLSEPRCRRL